MPERLRHLSPTTKRIVLLVAAVLLMIAAWVVYGAKTAHSPAPKDVLMVMTQRGGLCAPDKDNPNGRVCEASYRIFNDGRFDRHEAFSKSEIQQLKEIIDRTDFTDYAENPVPACPSYADGVDLILSFPAKHPGEQFTLCQLQIPKDDAGFRAIVELLDKHEGR